MSDPDRSQVSVVFNVELQVSYSNKSPYADYSASSAVSMAQAYLKDLLSKGKEMKQDFKILSLEPLEAEVSHVYNLSKENNSEQE